MSARTKWILVDDDAHEVVDPDLDMAAFVVDNDLDPDEVNALLALGPGGSRVYGGGASPMFSVVRTA